MSIHPSRRLVRLLAICAFAGVPSADVGRAAIADDDASASAGYDDYRQCEPGDGVRLAFLEQRLEENAPYARWFWRAWTGVYAAGMAYGGVQAALEDDRGRRADAVATAVKSGIGMGRSVLSQPEAILGVSDLLELPIDDAESCALRLERAERRLRRSAEQAEEERWGWIPHVVNLALNGAAAVVVAETYDQDSAYWNGALGLAVGEIRLWSYPWQAESNWEEYERRFDTTRSEPPESTWHLEPDVTGARLVVRF